MKLQTSIKPRRDGTVIVRGLDGVAHSFLPDDAGDLVCDIVHEPTVAHLLALDLFMPADEADFDRAFELAAGNQAAGDDDDDDAALFSEGNGLPIEANTPLAAPVAAAVAFAAPAPRAPARTSGRKSTAPVAPSV